MSFMDKVSDYFSNDIAIDLGTASGIKYEGCYKDNTEHTLPMYQGEKTPTECAQRAHDIGADVFGMQNSRGPTGDCWVGNSMSKAKSLGISVKSIPIWVQSSWWQWWTRNNIKQLVLGYDGNLLGFKRAYGKFDEIASSADLGGSSNYSTANVED